jgi:hypothetical protein
MKDIIFTEIMRTSLEMVNFREAGFIEEAIALESPIEFLLVIYDLF